MLLFKDETLEDTSILAEAKIKEYFDILCLSLGHLTINKLSFVIFSLKG